MPNPHKLLKAIPGSITGSGWQEFSCQWQRVFAYSGVILMSGAVDPCMRPRKALQMNAVTLLREQVQQAHAFLNVTVGDVTPEQAHWCPPGTANPLGATYVHAIASEDAAIHMVLQGSAPLFASEWADKTGVSEMQPLSSYEWARRVQVDLPVLHRYAAAVHAATDAYLASLRDEDLARPVDMSQFGLGMQTIGSILNRLVLGHIDNMCGEISCLKGLQGGKGYPF